MRRESDRDRQGGRGLAWLVKSLVFTLKAKRSPGRFQEEGRHLDWHFKTFLLGNQSDALECPLDSEQGDWGFSPLCHHQLCVSG